MNIIYEEQKTNIPLSQFIMRLGNVTINNIIITDSITTIKHNGTTQNYKVTGAIILIEPKVSIHTPESDLEASEQDAIDLRKKYKQERIHNRTFDPIQKTKRIYPRPS